MGRPSRYTLPHGIALTDKRPGSTSRWSTRDGGEGGGGDGRFTTGARVVTGVRVARTGARVVDRGGNGSGAAATNVSLLALDDVGGTLETGAGARATGSRLAGDAGIEEMPSHAAPPPSATSRPAAAAAIRPPKGLAAGSSSASTITTGEPGPFLRGFAPNHAGRASGRVPPRAATKSSTLGNRSACRLESARRSACETCMGSPGRRSFAAGGPSPIGAPVRQ